MSTETNVDAEFFDRHFSKCVEKVKQDGKIILAYDGVLNSETISKLEAEIEANILDKNLPKAVVKKVFFICIESLQNMFIHGHKDEAGAKHNFFVLIMLS